MFTSRDRRLRGSKLGIRVVTSTTVPFTSVVKIEILPIPAERVQRGVASQLFVTDYSQRG